MASLVSKSYTRAPLLKDIELLSEMVKSYRPLLWDDCLLNTILEDSLSQTWNIDHEKDTIMKSGVGGGRVGAGLPQAS